jgi:predicted glycosyltransferase involved in capsule biosynthesis
VLAGDELSPSGVVTPNTFSGVTAIPRGLWDAVGGYDERFVGWGWEDLSLWSACCALAGYERVPGPIYHLWHPRSWEQNEGSPDHPRNQVLGERYLAAKHDREAMLAILAERC